jgi:2-methylcitrate dehydratase
MTEVQELAKYVTVKNFEDLSQIACDHLKIRIIDSFACAIGALHADSIHSIYNHIEDFGGNKLASLIGGGVNAPDHTTFYNAALIRYLDFNDSYLAKGETCHPSDNLAAIIAAGEYANANGKELLTALAIAYQIQCRLSDEAPVRAIGFDHTVQGAYAVSAGVAKILRLNQEQIANAIAISGTCNLALRVTRTGALSNWKGLAYPNTAFIGLHAAFLAMRGISGPLEVFEGNKGFKSLAGPFQIDWPQEDLERVTQTIIKKYNAEIHSQSVIEGILDLKARYEFSTNDIDHIDIKIFDVAYNIIGGGEEGDKILVRTKEEADHSLRYMVAVALIDNQLLPAQYKIDRIIQEDVQKLLRKVHISPFNDYSKIFPTKMPCLINITLKNGTSFVIEKEDYEGFHTRPFSIKTITQKFEQLTNPFLTIETQQKIIETITNLESLYVKDLTNLFSDIKKGEKK